MSLKDLAAKTEELNKEIIEMLSSYSFSSAFVAQETSHDGAIQPGDIVTFGEAPDEEPEPRFGERLREWLDDLRPSNPAWDVLREIADAIDGDVATVAAQIPAAQNRMKEDLRRQVEEAVERMRYTLSSLSLVDGGLHGERGGDTEGEGVDVLEAEPFLAELDRIFGERTEGRTRPRIVCLCGSTRFKEAFDEANYQEAMAGRIVLSVGFYMHASGNRHGEGVAATPEQKMAQDELHLRKIDLADEVLVLNVGGYIGESTGREIAHAEASGKPIRYLESRPGHPAPTRLPTP